MADEGSKRVQRFAVDRISNIGQLGLVRSFYADSFINRSTLSGVSHDWVDCLGKLVDALAAEPVNLLQSADQKHGDAEVFRRTKQPPDSE
jgi:hypothetical protein